MTLLSVNVNKFALLRNARGTNHPNLIDICKQCIQFGAEGITVHPRPDQRHAKYSDLPMISNLVGGFSVYSYRIAKPSIAELSNGGSSTLEGRGTAKILLCAPSKVHDSVPISMLVWNEISNASSNVMKYGASDITLRKGRVCLIVSVNRQPHELPRFGKNNGGCCYYSFDKWFGYYYCLIIWNSFRRMVIFFEESISC